MKNNESAGGIGFLGLLGIVFIVLKLCGVINWSWWIVLLPLYGGFAIFLTVALIFTFVCCVKYWMKRKGMLKNEDD